MRNLYILIIFCLLGVSCSHPEKYIYFQHKNADTLTTIIDSVATSVQATFKTDDLVSISVSAIDPEVVKPFNVISSKEDASKGGNTNGVNYLIDADGNIEFPVLGTLKIAGLNRIQTTNLLKERIKEHVKNPIVNVRLQNFKITILGDVERPGVYTVTHDRITIPEALGLAGDLNITGERKNLLVIREEEGLKTETRIDLTTRELFKSPVYFLRQNDIIYVEPTKTTIAVSKPIGTYGSFLVAGTTLMISILNYFKK